MQGSRCGASRSAAGESDDYRPTTPAFLELAAKTGVSITDIRGQIRQTARGLRQQREDKG